MTTASFTAEDGREFIGLAQFDFDKGGWTVIVTLEGKFFAYIGKFATVPEGWEATERRLQSETQGSLIC